ncbi:ABC transporter ATP-binding protein/permease [Patescibacteria group bacterium]|nr:ABC transporter ATP-binding protein/permease [Patescibacteria group bacterium]
MSRIKQVIIQEVKPYFWRLVFVLSLMFLATASQAITPWPFKFLIDNVLGDELVDRYSFIGRIVSWFKNKQTLGFFVVFLFFASNIISSIVGYFQSIETAKVIRNIIYRFSEAAFENLQMFDIGFYRKQDVGDYIYRLSYDVSALGEMIESGILPIIASGLYFIGTTIILLLINVQLTLLSFGILPFFALSLYLINQRVVKASRKAEFRYSALFTFVQQALSQLKITQAYLQEKRQLRQYNKKMDSSLASDFKVVKLNLILSLIVGIIIGASYSFIIGLGINTVSTGQLSAGLLIVFIFYLDNLTAPVLDIIDGISLIKQNWVRINHMREFFNQKSHIKDAGVIDKMPDIDIRFDKVTLLGVHKKPILKNISCHVKPGKITAIIGTSGSGKSSFIALILRLINEPSRGRIYIGKHELKDYRLDCLRQHIAFVPQENILFNDSIKNIIAFGNPKASPAEIQTAAKLAVAHEFSINRPGGYDFKVGDQGNLLSGGQRQRLALARAYVRQAKILVLDEVFSAQDDMTKTKVLDNLRQYARGKTVVLVTNTLDVLKKSDNVILIDKGKVKYSGKFAGLKGGDN